MIEVNVPQGKTPEESAFLFDKAVKIFKKICDKDGVLQEVQERRYYNKPSEIKRLDNRRKENMFSKINKQNNDN